MITMRPMSDLSQLTLSLIKGLAEDENIAKLILSKDLTPYEMTLDEKDEVFKQLIFEKIYPYPKITFEESSFVQMRVYTPLVEFDDTFALSFYPFFIDIYMSEDLILIKERVGDDYKIKLRHIELTSHVIKRLLEMYATEPKDVEVDFLAVDEARIIGVRIQFELFSVNE